MSDRTKQVQFRMPDELHTKLKAALAYDRSSFADFFNKLIDHNCFLLEFIFFIFFLYIITNIIHETNDLIKCFLHIHLDIFRSGRYNSTHRRREP